MEDRINLLSVLYKSYIRPLKNALEDIEDELDKYDEIASSANLNYLLNSAYDQKCTNTAHTVHNALRDHVATRIDENFMKARRELASVFRRIIVGYMSESLGIMDSEIVELRINISLVDRVIREFTIIDYITGSDDIVEHDILKILGVADVERYTDVYDFCRVLELCLVMMIDIATYIAIRREGIYNKVQPIIDRSINANPYSYSAEFYYGEHESDNDVRKAMNNNFLVFNEDMAKKITPPSSGTFSEALKDENFEINVVS